MQIPMFCWSRWDNCLCQEKIKIMLLGNFPESMLEHWQYFCRVRSMEYWLTTNSHVSCRTNSTKSLMNCVPIGINLCSNHTQLYMQIIPCANKSRFAIVYLLDKITNTVHMIAWVCWVTHWRGFVCVEMCLGSVRVCMCLFFCVQVWMWNSMYMHFCVQSCPYGFVE